MRIAIVSDIHGNRTAFEAVLADLRGSSPDLVLNGGDLVHGGSGDAEVVDRVRDLGWPGVMGNTDEMLFRPQALEDFAAETPTVAPLLPAIREMAAASREALGEGRLAWLAGLPIEQIHPPVAVVHASPQSCWRAPGPEAPDADLQRVYGALGQPLVVYGHIHRSYVRTLSGMMVANSGSVSLSYDGDARAAYLLVDDGRPSIRRVAYGVEKECRLLAERRVPHAVWIAKMLRAGSFQTP